MHDDLVSDISTRLDLPLFYGYFVVAAMLAGWLVLRSNIRYKFEILLVSFYLMTGSINYYLTIKIPGVSFFELQPDRILFFVFTFLFLRRFAFSREQSTTESNWRIPWFLVFACLHSAFVIMSLVFHVKEIGMPDVIVKSIYVLNFLLILWGLKTISTDEETLRIIRASILIGAVVSAVVSLVQISIDPMFMRMGDQRPAFGSILRSNGIFNTEYFNSYFLITAILWVLLTMKSGWMKVLLVCLFAAGVVSTFQRMSWLVLCLVLATYLLSIAKIPFERLALAGMTAVAALVAVSLLFSSEIQNSTLVKERLSEGVDGCIGYFGLALESIGKKPLFGFGGRNNEVYYYGMLRITKNRHRAEGAGSFHNGYLECMFELGLPAALCFALFGLFAMFYFGNLTRHHLFFAIPFLFALQFVVGNLSNAFLFSKQIAIIYAMHLGMGLAARHNLGILSEKWGGNLSKNQGTTIE
ncbi:MAG: hypothetical protein K9J37_13060 [Saprospiraceae bacterium]|nr:hypothetical protein [Saprospiraceae bacterium]MCF8250837.1 hypothetical protein [Saprospiraceae bacterium]MCF8281654.1 hypothetical protein [Bacteroidales bacterium]MCF8312638.1 hypothetical protein [Saprospiraceae bacterium]MCF8441028.1 hypothetical protein [Saprospiraceae bacterium]